MMHPSHQRLLDYFEYSHLPPHLQAIVKPYQRLAKELANRGNQGADGPETTVALRKLLESKDAAVRAAL
jgi:hypothetical protein